MITYIDDEEAEEIHVFTVKAIEDNPDDTAVFVESRCGKTILQYNGHRYRKGYQSKNGHRWKCSVNKMCGAFVYLNDKDEIIMSNEEHLHSPPARFDYVDEDQSDTPVMIMSRKGKEILLFRQYTYRQQYMKSNRSRWVCSTQKNCRGCVFTDANKVITSAFEEHCHPPPQYYLKPDNLIGALKKPAILETD